MPMRRRAATGRAAVASGHPQVTATAADLLRAGGNAFDAAIAAGFVAAIAEPALTSLGGGGFLLARTAAGERRLFDFFVDTPGRGAREATLEPHFVPVTVQFPASTQVFNVGLGSVATPGNLKGLLHVHRQWGRLPLTEVLAPAVRLARDGLVLNGQQGYFLDLLQPVMTLTAAGRALFQAGGRYVKAGDRLANPAMATFLETLPHEGEREFYEGEIARRIVQDMVEGQGLLTLADLAACRVIEREPLVARYRVWRLLTNPPPSFGGPLIALSLRLLADATPVAASAVLEPGYGTLVGAAFGSPGHRCRLVAVLVEVERLRAAGCLGPDDLDEARLAASLTRLASGGTTHLSVCDAEGNVASMTTSNGEGSGYLVPGTGIMLNNMMGEDDLHPDGFHASPPGTRVASMMSPSLLLDAAGRVRLVLGSGGSKRIRTAILQVLSNLVDGGLDLKAAVEAPRLHWDGEQLQCEPGFAAASLAALAARWPINHWPVQDLYFGGVHAVSPQGESAGDPRRGGSALVLD
jgi:gamma-glutamyltranspeptidase/glutathione hydrolase